MQSLDALRRLALSLISCLPLWALAYLLYRTWQTPMEIDGGRWVKLGVGIMVLEFILVHSGAFFSAFSQKKTQSNPDQFTPKLFVGLVAFYLLFAVAFSLAFNSWMLFWIFCGVTASRLISLYFDPRAGAQMLARSAISILLYLFSVFLSVWVSFPPGGLTRQILDEVYPGRGGGVWEQHPQQALVAGIIYFGLLGLWELWQPLRKPAETTSEKRTTGIENQ